jgi:hypothetical protein
MIAIQGLAYVLGQWCPSPKLVTMWNSIAFFPTVNSSKK